MSHPNFVSKTISKINNFDLKILETPELKENNDIRGDIILNINELNKNL